MNKKEKDHLSKIADYGCIVCDTLGFTGTPAEIHHIRDGQGKGQRSSHFDAIPLCPLHHRLGAYGVAFHAGKKEWIKNFGSEKELLTILHNKLKNC